MSTTETNHVMTNWRRMERAAHVAAGLATLARHGTVPDVADAVAAMPREQLEAAAVVLAVVHAEGAPMVDPPADG